MARPPGSGDFTCCMRDHKMKNPDGTERGIPCDKVKIDQLSWAMLQSKLSYMLGDDQIAQYRLWLALVPRFMQGLPDNGAALKAGRSCDSSSRLDAAEAEDAVKDFLSTYHFRTAKEEEGRGESGLSPLMHAGMVGNVEVAEELINQGADVHCKLRKFNAMTGADAGMTGLHFAVCLCPARHVEMIAMLLRAGADANAPSKADGTPLIAGVMYHNMPGVRALLQCAKDMIDLEKGIGINNATALGIAAYMGSPNLCEIIIEAGADLAHTHDHGGTKLHDAPCNAATTRQMLDLLWNNGELDVNAVQRSRTVFWKLIDVYFIMVVNFGLMIKSQFVMDMAHTVDATPLHGAAKHGLLDVAEWLLNHGAHKPLHIRNKMGATPLDVARIFGPYPAIEAKLGAAMLDHQFDAQFVIRRGSLLRKQAGGAIDPEAADDDDLPSDENRSIELTPVETLLDSKSVSSGIEGKAEESVVDTPALHGHPTDPAPVETIAGGGIDCTADGALVDDTRDACPAANQVVPYGPLVERVDSLIEVGAALAMLSSDVEARFDKQTASLAARFGEQATRFDVQTASFATRFDEQAARSNALQSENAAIMAKLDVLLAAQQQQQPW